VCVGMRVIERVWESKEGDWGLVISKKRKIKTENRDRWKRWGGRKRERDWHRQWDKKEWEINRHLHIERDKDMDKDAKRVFMLNLY